MYELHDNGYIQYQNFKDQLIGVHAPEEEPRVERPVEEYKSLVGSRHIDPKNGLTYETVDIKITPTRDIVAWRRRVIKGVLQDTPQGPFHAEDIYQYTQFTVSRMLEPKRTSGLHSPSGVSPYVPVDQAHEPDVNAGGRLRGVLQPTLDSTVTETATPAAKGRGTKRNLTSYQNDSARVPATTLEPQRTNARNERNTNTGYNLRIPSTGVPLWEPR